MAKAAILCALIIGYASIVQGARLLPARSLLQVCTYTIQPGDTFWAIAQAHGTSADAVQAVNPGVQPEQLQVGQVINLPNCEASTRRWSVLPTTPDPAPAAAPPPVFTARRDVTLSGLPADWHCPAADKGIFGNEVYDNVPGKSYGCHKGSCWSWCNTNIPFFGSSADGHEWCYTTKGSSQDYNYVSCRVDTDCCQHWKCAGACTL